MMKIKEPVILLFHTCGRESDVPMIRSICAEQKISVKIIEPSGENAPLGLLAGAADWQRPLQNIPRQIPLKEMVMVLCGLNDRQLDRFLAALRAAGLKNILKACLTDCNALWNAPALYGEISSEREYFMGKQK